MAAGVPWGASSLDGSDGHGTEIYHSTSVESCELCAQGESFDILVSKDDVVVSKGQFRDMGDGSYLMTYMIKEIGEYEIFVSARGVEIAGSPFVVYAIGLFFFFLYAIGLFFFFLYAIGLLSI